MLLWFRCISPVAGAVGTSKERGIEHRSERKNKELSFVNCNHSSSTSNEIRRKYVIWWHNIFCYKIQWGTSGNCSLMAYFHFDMVSRRKKISDWWRQIRFAMRAVNERSRPSQRQERYVLCLSRVVRSTATLRLKDTTQLRRGCPCLNGLDQWYEFGIFVQDSGTQPTHNLIDWSQS